MRDCGGSGYVIVVFNVYCKLKLTPHHYEILYNFERLRVHHIYWFLRMKKEHAPKKLSLVSLGARYFAE